MMFFTTHYRKSDNLRAQLLADRNGIALYRVRYEEGDKFVTRLTSASSTHFSRTFA